MRIISEPLCEGAGRGVASLCGEAVVGDDLYGVGGGNGSTEGYVTNFADSCSCAACYAVEGCEGELTRLGIAFPMCSPAATRHPSCVLTYMVAIVASTEPALKFNSSHIFW